MPEHGTVLEGQAMPSAVIGRELPYCVYLPPGYVDGDRRYPVLILLHGLDGNETDWIRSGRIDRFMDAGIGDGSVEPMIVACPFGGRFDGSGDATFYMNDADGDYRWEEMFVSEFVPRIDAAYRTRGAEARGIGGLSMGGFGAVRFALLHPELFPNVVGLSATLFTGEQIMARNDAEYAKRFGRAFGNPEARGEARLNPLYRANDPLHLAEAMTAEELSAVNFHLTCGAEDGIGLYEGNAVLHNLLMRKGVEHSFSLVPGRHDWAFWRRSTPEALAFLTRVFRQPAR